MRKTPGSESAGRVEALPSGLAERAAEDLLGQALARVSVAHTRHEEPLRVPDGAPDGHAKAGPQHTPQRAVAGLMNPTKHLRVTRTEAVEQLRVLEGERHDTLSDAAGVKASSPKRRSDPREATSHASAAHAAKAARRSSACPNLRRRAGIRPP